MPDMRLIFGSFAPLAATATIGAGVGIAYGETHRNRRGDPDWARGADAGILGFEAATFANQLISPGFFRGTEFKKAELFGEKTPVDGPFAGVQAANFKQSIVKQGEAKFLGMSFAHPMHEMALHSGAYAISGFLTGLSIFGSSEKNTTNIKAGIYTGLATGGLSFVSQLRSGNVLFKTAEKSLKRALIN